jgi:hypothetical protein
MRGRRLGFVVLAIGALAIVVAQRVAPLPGPPLYDGVVVVELYRWLVPPPGQGGDPLSASGTVKVERGASPLLALATGEQPPQAQIFAAPGSLVLPAATTSISMSIKPIAADVQPVDGHIAGNVYRITVTDQAGNGLTGPASARMTVVLRGPAEESIVSIEQRTFQGWRPLKTEDAGFGSTYLAVVTGFGDFALVGPGPSGPYGSQGAQGSASAGPSSSGPSPAASSTASPAPSSRPGSAGSAGPPIALIAGAVALVILGAIGLAGLRQRDRRRQRYRGAHRRRR